GLLFLLLPGPKWIVLMGILGGVLMALWFSLAYMEHTCEHRLVKHGYSLGTGRAVREEAKAEQREREAAAYRAAWRNPGTSAGTAGGETAGDETSPETSPEAR